MRRGTAHQKVAVSGIIRCSGRRDINFRSGLVCSVRMLVQSHRRKPRDGTGAEEEFMSEV